VLAVISLYAALLPALRAPDWHGASVDALVDSMVFGGINEIEPPYVVTINGVAAVPECVRSEIEVARDAIMEARETYRSPKGHDVDVRLEIEE
jgi:hypothetical protein